MITVLESISVRDSMKQLNSTAKNGLVVVNSNGGLLGVLTDGDIRRHILSGGAINDSITNVYNKKPVFLSEDEDDKELIKQQFLTHKIDFIPIVDSKMKVTGYRTIDELFGNGHPHSLPQLNAPVVIMAGGRGTRLEPFTKILPKPLIPVNDKTIVEHIIDRFIPAGCSDFYLTVNYKSKIIKAYFDELDPAYSVTFIDELKPLGTAGGLKYLEKKMTRPFFVTNCDIIVKTNYAKLYDYHLKNKYDITLVASAKEFTIPYGTCKLSKDGTLLQISEKPKYDHLINTGLYILNPEILEIIPADEYYHITHLIAAAKLMGITIGVFPVDESCWVDIGQWNEFKMASDKLL